MKSTLLYVAALVLALPLPAQRTLADLQRDFVKASRELAEAGASREQQDGLLKGQIADLGRFVEAEAKDDDRWNGRLMLADLNLIGGHREAALAALESIDSKAAPALLLVSAATMAQHLGKGGLRNGWIEAALAKPAPVADRMAMARLLMIPLHEIEAAEKLLAASLAAASDDEQRAFVRWHRADALRDREDLPENTGFDELEKLARDLPETYWGSVAKDRLRATRLDRGDSAIDFKAQTLDGNEVSLRGLRGKAVALAFWSAGDYDIATLLSSLAEQQKKHGSALAIVGICLDRDPAAIAEATARLGIEFPVIGTGKGIETDAALRWFVEGPTLHIIDRAGRVAALGLHAGTADARAELGEVIAAVLR